MFTIIPLSYILSLINYSVRVKGVVSRHSKQAAIRNGKKSKANKQKSASTLGMIGQA